MKLENRKSIEKINKTKSWLFKKQIKLETSGQVKFKKNKEGGVCRIPWLSSSSDFVLPFQEALVQSLVREVPNVRTWDTQKKT